MLASFVSTGRQKLTSRQVALNVLAHGPLKVAARFRFESLPQVLPEHEVVVAANRRTRTQRVELGRVADLQPVTTLVFDRYQDAMGVSMDVRVVDAATRRLIARGEDMKLVPLDADQPSDDGEAPAKGRRVSALDVMLADAGEIGDLFWRVDFSSPKKPILLLNPKKFQMVEQARDPQVMALAMPEIVRTVLTKAFVSDAVNGAFPTWAKNWLMFTRTTLGVEGGPDEPPLKDALPDYLSATFAWIDRAVSAFAAHRGLANIDLKLGGAK